MSSRFYLSRNDRHAEDALVRVTEATGWPCCARLDSALYPYIKVLYPVFPGAKDAMDVLRSFSPLLITRSWQELRSGASSGLAGLSPSPKVRGEEQ
jgi:hypothetical protein